MKNTAVCKMRPAGVGQPPFDTVNSEPNTVCVTLYVSGHARRKKTRAL